MGFYLSRIFEMKLVSSLEKVFPDSEVEKMGFSRFSMLKNEKASFQMAYKLGCPEDGEYEIEIDSPLKDEIHAYCVRLIPSQLAAPKNADEYYIKKESGEYPDLLEAIDLNAPVRLSHNGWQSVWFEIKTAGELPAGEHLVRVQVSQNGKILAASEIGVEVIAARLPEQTLIYTNWYHTDCLMRYYKTEAFSEDYWRITENYLRHAREYGMNCVLTPLFTLPLDTKVGGERPTVQLVDVKITGKNEYEFGFEKLDRWLEMCERCKVPYIEMSHLFTQWGAKHAPKIIATTAQGEEKQIFGWKTKASGKQYVSFLKQFAPALDAYLDKKGIRERCLFHVSDEPAMYCYFPYKKASKLVHKLFHNYKVIDALSDFKFYKKGLIDTPIPANDHVGHFIGNVPELWTYYCSAQSANNVSNRYFSMASERNRVLGCQLYKFDVKGFLHWGYNFWFSQYSIREIDPFQVTDAGGAFASGDSFVVYPGANGEPMNSLRLNVFYDGLQDMMAMQLLESKIGRQKVVELLEAETKEPITFSSYPHSSEWLLKTREKINQAIKESI